MTKINCKKGVCKLVPSKHYQVEGGIQPRASYYLVPVVRKSARIAKKKNKTKQTGAGKSSSSKAGKKKPTKSTSNNKSTSKKATKKPTKK